MKNKYIEDILQMPSSVRKKLFVPGKRRGRRCFHKYHPNIPDYSKEEIIRIIKERGIKSKRDYHEKREMFDPTLVMIRKKFGNWSNMLYEAYPDIKEKMRPLVNPIRPDFEVTAEYVLKVMCTYELYTRQRYEKARHMNPNVIPTMSDIEKLWGSWRRAVYFAKKYNMRGVMKSYMILRNKLGRWPSLAECRKNHLDMEPLLKVYKSKQEFDKMLEGLDNEFKKAISHA